MKFPGWVWILLIIFLIACLTVPGGVNDVITWIIQDALPWIGSTVKDLFDGPDTK